MSQASTPRTDASGPHMASPAPQMQSPRRRGFALRRTMRLLLGLGIGCAAVLVPTTSWADSTDSGAWAVGSFTADVNRTASGPVGSVDSTDFYYPLVATADRAANEDAFPLVVFLEGAKVDRGLYSRFASGLAAEGYVVAVPNHIRSFAGAPFPLNLIPAGLYSSQRSVSDLILDVNARDLAAVPGGRHRQRRRFRSLLRGRRGALLRHEHLPAALLLRSADELSGAGRGQGGRAVRHEHGRSDGHHLGCRQCAAGGLPAGCCRRTGDPRRDLSDVAVDRAVQGIGDPRWGEPLEDHEHPGPPTNTPETNAQTQSQGWSIAKTVKYAARTYGAYLKGDAEALAALLTQQGETGIEVDFQAAP